jgi:oligopeptide transport system permease protein
MFTKKLEKLNLENATVNNSIWKDALLRFKKHKLAVASLWVLLSIILLSIVVPMVSFYAYDYVDWSVSFPSKPSLDDKHFLGTDGNGRDLLTRIFMGVRISIFIGILAASVSFIIGALWGSISGYLGGKIDLIMMRIVDVLYAIPFMFLIIIIMVVFGRNITLIFVSLGAISWLTMSRIVRGQTISIKNKEFVHATKSYSLSNTKVIFRHIFPNLIGTIIIYVTLTIPNIILIESFISFLGLGVQEPMTSLGILIAEGSKTIEDYPWMFIFPFITLSLILFCFNFIGDGLRDAFDQKNK